MSDLLIRCGWCGSDPLYTAYHDREWGVPLRDDRALFELLVLEGAQAGLSWLTILRKRDNYRRAFSGFEVEHVCRFGTPEVERLLQDSGIVRNRKKIEAAVNNAAAVLRIKKHYGSFTDYLWQFVDHRPIQHHYRTLAEIPARSPESDRMATSLKAQGFSFVGSTICYAFMQSAGMVNDHLVDCFRHRQVQELST